MSVQNTGINFNITKNASAANKVGDIVFTFPSGKELNASIIKKGVYDRFEVIAKSPEEHSLFSILGYEKGKFITAQHVGNKLNRIFEGRSKEVMNKLGTELGETITRLFR